MSDKVPDHNQLKKLIAKNLALPEDDPERIEFELQQWIGGADVVCKWQLSVQTGRDCWNVPWDEYQSALVAFCRERLPEPSCAAIGRSSGGAYFARIYLEDLRRRAGSTIFGPLKKPEQAVILLLESPELNDEQVAKLIPTTLKQLGRFTLYNYLRSEIRFATQGIGE